MQTRGHVCLLTPANNEFGHGFYQFSPELFFRLFTINNGFILKSIILIESRPFSSRWYTVTDPSSINARVCCVNRHPLFLIVLAQKVTESLKDKPVVFQSDYMEAWSGRDILASDTTRLHSRKERLSVKAFLRSCVSALPLKIRRRITDLYSIYFVRRLRNTTFFNPIKKGTFKL